MASDSETSDRYRLTDVQFRVLMDLTMVSDPWPLDRGDETIQNLLHSEAKRRGFDGWYVAYHEMGARR